MNSSAVINCCSGCTLQVRHISPHTNPHRAFRFHPAAHEQQSVRSEMREAKEMPAFVLSPSHKEDAACYDELMLPSFIN